MPTRRAYLVSAVLGIAITCLDLFGDHGELSPAVPLLLLSLAGAFTIALHPRVFLAPVLLIAGWLPATHAVLHALGHPSTLQPDTTNSILGVGLAALAATFIGGLVGAAVRRSRAV